MSADVVSLDRSGDSCGPDPAVPAFPLEGDETPARILRAGLTLFATQGYPGTSIREIAAGAGIQSASLYFHFANKEAILAEIVRIGTEVHHRALVTALADAGADPRDQLRALVAAHVTLYCRYATLAAVTAQEQHHLSPEVRAPTLALADASKVLLETVVARGVEQGCFSATEPELLLVALASLGISVVHWYPSRAGQFSPERVGEGYAAFALLMAGAGPV